MCQAAQTGADVVRMTHVGEEAFHRVPFSVRKVQDALERTPPQTPTNHGVPTETPTERPRPAPKSSSYLLARSTLSSGLGVDCASYIRGLYLASGGLEFSFIPAGSSAAVPPAPASSAPVSTFNPTVLRAQSFSVSFPVPASVSSGTLVVSLSSGSELYRQQLGWIVSK